MSPEVWFYVPSPELVASVPPDIKDYWNWIEGAVESAPVILPEGSLYSGRPCTWLGPYNWTVQTFIYLRQYGFPCSITHTLPDQGIIISHSDFIPPRLRPSSDQFIVELKPDRILNCYFSNFVIVQNNSDPLLSGISRLLIDGASVFYWPQPNLIPRDPNRGDRFENICFMGIQKQFIWGADRLASEIKQLGLSWRMVPRKNWNDYSEVDAIVAVRRFNSSNFDETTPEDSSPLRKPPTKLYNAWLAGVPAILSPEPAFQALKKSDLDYLEACNVSQTVARLKRLRGDIPLRRAMIENGRIRSSEFSIDTLVNKWIHIIDGKIIAAYKRRKKYKSLRTASTWGRELSLKFSPALLRR